MTLDQVAESCQAIKVSTRTINEECNIIPGAALPEWESWLREQLQL